MQTVECKVVYRHIKFERNKFIWIQMQATLKEYVMK